MTRPPPRPTLFPYTTLFRSNRRSLFVPDTLDLSFAPEVWQRLIRVKRKKRTKLARRPLEVCIFAAVADELKSGDLAVEGSDRKSTRLNSSHSQISYAVFCLT